LKYNYVQFVTYLIAMANIVKQLDIHR